MNECLDPIDTLPIPQLKILLKKLRAQKNYFRADQVARVLNERRKKK